MARDRSNADKQAFGAAVQACRQDQEVTQAELAHRAGIHRTYLADIERGFRNPSLRIICQIARALGRKTAELFTIAKL